MVSRNGSGNNNDDDGGGSGELDGNDKNGLTNGKSSGNN